MDLHFNKCIRWGIRIRSFVIFTKFDITIEVDDSYIDIQIHETALPLLNNLEYSVRYALANFRDLHNRYSKTVFQLLKQYIKTGIAEFSKEDFN